MKEKTMLVTQALVLMVGCVMIGILLSYGDKIYAVIMGLWTVGLLEYNRRNYIRTMKP